MKELLEYERFGLVQKRSHPTLPLYIWNYSQKTTYEQMWDEVTLKARALVTDHDLNLVSSSFKKFFNWEEPLSERGLTGEVFEKMDGSFIQLFHYKDQWVVSSKGSFDSDWSNFATGILKKKYPAYVHLDRKTTYVFELVSNKSKFQVVCDYPKDDLVLLAAFTEGIEVPIENISLFPRVKKYNVDLDYNYLKSLNFDNKEGFVIRWDNGERCKIKFEKYIELHRITTNITSYSIWKALQTGNFYDIIERCPDELLEWVFDIKNDIYKDYLTLTERVFNEWRMVALENFTSKKQFAEAIKHSPYKYYLFNLQANKDISDLVWAEVKPSYKSFFE